MDSDSKVCPIGIFIVGFMEDYGRGNQFCEVVQDKSGKDFLVNVLHFFCVKMQQADCVFELPERGFNAPAHGIKAFELVRGKIKIRDDSFNRAVRQFETDKTERDLEGQNGDRLFIFHGKEMILSRLVDTFSSRILYPMLLLSGNHSIAAVLSWEEGLH